MGGFALGLIGAAPSALRVIYLVVWRRRFGWPGWIGAALVLIEVAGTVLVHETLFAEGTAFVHGTALAGRAALAGRRTDRRPVRDTRNLSRRGGPGRGSAFPSEW